ncbi:MAG: hypothetical protein R3E48_11595 [Burkholderiaceae bacterium]
MVTAVVFSATLSAADAPPPSEVMTGALSLTGSHRHADGLGVGAARAIVGLDRDVVDVVGASIGRRFIVRGGQEAQRAGHAVNGEQRGIGAADDAVVHRLRRQVGVGGDHGGHGGGVLGDVDRCTRAAAVRGDDRVVVVDRGDRDADRLGLGAPEPVVDLDGEVVDVVGTGVERGLVVGGGEKAERARNAVDDEQGRVGAARGRVVGRTTVDVGARDGGDGGRVLGDVHPGRGTTTIGRDHRRLVGVGDGDRDRLGIGPPGAVVDLDGDVVDVVRAGIERGLEVGGGEEAERSRHTVDREEGGIGAADDGVVHRLGGQVGVGRRHGGDRGGVLGDIDRGRGAAAVGGDDRVFVVDRGDRDGDGLGVGATGAIVGLDGDVVDVVGTGIGRPFVVRGGQEAERTGDAIDGEQGRVGATDDAVVHRLRGQVGVGGGDGGHGRGVLGDADRGRCTTPSE